MKTLYFDCFAGASGNMILAALIAAGVDSKLLTNELQKLGIPDFDLKLETVDRSGISAKHLDVVVPDEKAHRHLHHIESIISGSDLSETVKERSVLIFRRLAEAEAAVHGIQVEKVHFHEVGALDAVIDIVGSCIGFEMLGIEQFVCSRIHVGSGFVEMEHGKFPVPPPAVADLLREIPIYSTEIIGELITPTGAAIISTLSSSYGSLPKMELEQTAYGAGTRTYDKFPNVLRIMIGRTTEQHVGAANERLSLLETNIDDMSPQFIGHTMEKAFEAGALDCWFTPIQMKKNRPATMISVLVNAADEQRMLDLLYAETTTLGVRIQRIERNAVERSFRTVTTEYGDISVKVAGAGGSTGNIQPEFEDLKAAAAAHGVPLKVVADSVRAKSFDIEEKAVNIG